MKEGHTMYNSSKFAILEVFRFLLILDAIVRTVSAQIALKTSCPRVNVVQDFNIQKYSGVWFEIESYPSIIDQFDVCLSLNYTVQSSETLTVVSSWFNTSSRTHEAVQGTARLISHKQGAKFLVTFGTSPIVQNDVTEGNFWILETDYINYAIVFLCLSDGQNGSLQFLSYLSRERLPFMAGLSFVRQRVDSLGLNQSFLKPIDQINCPTKTKT